MKSRVEIEERIQELEDLLELTNKILMSSSLLSHSTRQRLETEWGSMEAVINNLKWVLNDS